MLIEKPLEIKKKEKQISLASNNKTETYNEKWCNIDNILSVT